MADTEKALDDAAQTNTLIDLQSMLIELTTRLMGNMAYDVCSAALVLLYHSVNDMDQSRRS